MENYGRSAKYIYTPFWGETDWGKESNIPSGQIFRN